MIAIKEILMKKIVLTMLLVLIDVTISFAATSEEINAKAEQALNGNEIGRAHV